MYTQYANFVQYFLHSPHSEVTEAAVYAAKCTQLQDAGAAADRMAGKGALWVLCGGLPEEKDHQKLIYSWSHLPVPQGEYSL